MYIHIYICIHILFIHHTFINRLWKSSIPERKVARWKSSVPRDTRRHETCPAGGMEPVLPNPGNHGLDIGKSSQNGNIPQDSGLWNIVIYPDIAIKDWKKMWLSWPTDQRFLRMHWLMHLDSCCRIDSATFRNTDRLKSHVVESVRRSFPQGPRERHFCTKPDLFAQRSLRGPCRMMQYRQDLVG